MERKELKVITISGHAGSGKDTVAKILKEELERRTGVQDSVLITHYADVLKYICKTYLGWDGKKDNAGRQLLQNVGTNMFRANNQDFFVDFLCQILKTFRHMWQYVVIPDARFPNEIEMLRDEGFTVTHIRVTRDNESSIKNPDLRKHASEISLDDYNADILINNNGSLLDLNDYIKNNITEYLL